MNLFEKFLIIDNEVHYLKMYTGMEEAESQTIYRDSFLMAWVVHQP